MMLSHAELIGRMAVGTLLGSVIGYERDRHGRPVGLRTHMLVSLSAATFMVVSSQFAYYQHFDGVPGIEVDASRIAASVVAAIGFLAGGSILRTGGSVAGLTTAAGLWLVTAIGLCAGAGMFAESTAATAFGMLALTLVRRFEDKDDRVVKRRIELHLGADPDAIMSAVIEAIGALGGSVIDVEYTRILISNEPSSLILDINLPITVGVRQLMTALERQPGLVRIQVRSTP